MKQKVFFYWGIVCCCLFFFLQYEYRFHFYYIEQFQLFPFTWDYFTGTCAPPGGGAFYLANFLLQFYRLAYGGALISVGLFLVAGLLTQLICRKIAPFTTCYLLTLLPVLALLPLHVDINYRLQGTVSICFMLAALLVYLCGGCSWMRMVVGALLLPALFWVAGPVVVLFVACVLVWETLSRKDYWAGSLFLLGELGVALCLSHLFAWQVEWRMLLLPDFYYEPLLKTDKIYYAWLMLPVCILVAWLLRKKREPARVKDYWLISFQLLPLPIFLYWMVDRGDPIFLENEKQDYYLRTERWEDIISNYSAGKPNLQTLSILNLALAYKGELGNRLFHYPQFGREGLLPEWDSSLWNAIALSEICYHIGDVASAQKFAFEGYVASIDGNPRLLQRLVQTNLIFGAYPVAEKYIKILEQTLFYREWAKKQRSFLYNDILVEADDVLGEKRKALVGTGRYAVCPSVLETLEQLAVNYPDRPAAFSYLLAYHILGKNLKEFDRLHEKYYRTKVWPRMEMIHQEAMVALYQDAPSLWAHKGVSLKVEQRYGAFMQDMKEKHGYVNFKDVMAASYGDSYWFYLVFNKKKKEGK